MVNPEYLEYSLQEYSALRKMALALKEYRELTSHTERGRDIFTVLADLNEMSKEDLDEF